MNKIVDGMVPLTSHSQNSTSWEYEVVLARSDGDYDRAAMLCEQQIEMAPDNRQAYWHLGVVWLLQEQEDAAQLAWMTALSETTPEEEEVWINEIIEILEGAIQEQVQIGNLALAWTLRQYIREFAPTRIDNLLSLIQLSIKLERFCGQDLINLGIIDLLESNSDRVAVDCLIETVSQLPIDSLRNVHVIKFVETCIFYGNNKPQEWIKVLTIPVYKLDRRTACIYGELALKLDERDDYLLRLVSKLYLNAQYNYDRSIELAIAHRNSTDSLQAQITSCDLLITGYLMKGEEWNKVEQILHEQSLLLKRWIDLETAHTGLEVLDIVNIEVDNIVLSGALFLYPYFEDYPCKDRTLQNTVGAVFQQRLQERCKAVDQSYHPYPSRIIESYGDIEKKLQRQNQKKIRIGYYSKSMYRHSVGWLSRWLFHHHDRSKFEIHAYFDYGSTIDTFSDQWFVSNVDKAMAFEDGDILGVAKEIQSDGVDILIDLDSLTNANNYGVLALKPAPVQVTWLGLDATGLPAVDYFIVDPYVVPDHAQEYYSEKLWRLPQTYLAVDGFEVWMPTLSRSDLDIPSNAIIYLSSQVASKRNPNTLKLQFQILQQVPNSYLLIKGVGDSQGIQRLFYRMADEAGVSRDRLRFLGRDRLEETHRANLGIADVVLDTFPYSGATTTIETLWMGIPLVTRVGQQFAARNSYTMMVNAGISEGIAWTDEEYVDWGVRFGKDASLRDEVRWKLYQSRRTAPLWNAEKFTRQMESAYEQMWKIYCQG